MQAINITEKKQFNNFLISQKHSQFLQSWQWGEFQEQVGGKVFRPGVINEGELAAVATLIKKTLPMGKSYFFCPRGPIFNAKDKEQGMGIRDALFNKIGELAKEEGVMFLRFEPSDIINSSGFEIRKTIDIEPRETSVLNLGKSNEDVLAGMHQKTRYNIRLAQRKGVKIYEASLEGFDDFWRLMSETSERDKFRLHGKNYYKNMLRIDKEFVKLFFAKYKNENIATSIVSFFGDSATYFHGASSDKNRNVMAPYFLHWHCIKLAQEKGCKYYDFFGIDEDRWPGVTRFKKGFGGKDVEYPGTFDLIFDSGWYNIYKMVRRVRRTF